MKYVNLKGLHLTWTPILTIPAIASGANNYVPGAYGVIVNGHYGLFYACSNNNATNRGAALILFDNTGGYCIYKTSNYTTNNFNTLTDTSLIDQAGNTITYKIVNGGTFKVTFPPIYKAGATYIIPQQALTGPNPCNPADTTPDKMLYCSQQDLICYEYIQVFSETDNYWASVYNGIGNFKGGGFIGNASHDPFDRLSLALPPFVISGDVFNKNGYYMYYTGAGTAAINQVYGFTQPYLFGDPSSLVCGGVGNNNVYVSGINNTQIFYNKTYGIPAASGSQFGQATDSSATDLPGYFIACDANAMRMFSKDVFIDFAAPAIGGAPSAYGLGYTASDQTFYAFFNNFGSGAGKTLYKATFDMSPYGPQPSVIKSPYNGLANYHRAISPTGLFQA